MSSITTEDMFVGCLLGGALGDALGYPVGEMSFEEITATYGKNGITEPAVEKDEKYAPISGNTQLTLFTAEGLIWADSLGAKTEISSYTSYVFYSYQRWLYTQTKMLASREYSHILSKEQSMPSRLLAKKAFYAVRSPDPECIEALTGAANHNYGRLINKINDCKGFGGVVRTAPAGLYFYTDSERAFRMGAEFAAITHTNPTGYLAAGALSAVIAEILSGSDIDEAADVAMYILRGYDNCIETYQALEHARHLEAGSTPPMEAVRRLGTGYTAEETLAIAVYCALCHSENAANAMCLAVNHDGNSAAAGAVCGNIIGAYLGQNKLPKKWLKRLRPAELVLELSESLYNCAKAGEV